jgi:hypothetical protein
MATDAELYSGDTKVITIAIVDENGDAVDVSDATSIIYGVYGRDGGEALISKALAGGVVAEENIVTITLDPDDTGDLGPGTYIHECQIIQLDNSVHTVLQGKLTILKDYVH